MKRNTRINHLICRIGFIILAMLTLNASQLSAQSITISSEPTGPLYVGENVEFEYSVTGFSLDAVFYLVANDGINDTILDYSTATSGNLTGLVPAGFNSPLSFNIVGATGNPDGTTETRPLFGELSIAGSADSCDYTDDTYTLYFWEPTIRRVVFPAANVDADTAILEFDYRYIDNPDSLEIVIEYSINNGSTYAALDTIEYVNTGWYFNTRVGIPSTARTSSTIFRMRQLYSNLINNEYTYRFYFQNPSIISGEDFNTEGTQSAAGSPFTVFLPYTDVTSVYAPAADPYFGNTYLGDSIHVEANIVGFTGDVKYELVFNSTGDISDPVHKLASYGKQNTGGNSWLFKGKLPNNIEFDAIYYFWVVPYRGLSYLHGTNVAHDFTGGTGLHTINGGSINGTYGAYFTSENVRELLTDEVMITEKGSLMVEVSRRENAFSPDNAELIIEYTTDGSAYTEIGTINLNGAKYYDDGATVFEIDIPVEAVSNTTSFRIAQKNINAGNLDRYYIASIEILLNSNRLIHGLEASYSFNDDSDYINGPVIDLKTIVVPDDLFYPGTEITLNYEVLAGKFPTGTEMQAILYLSGQDVVLGKSTNLSSGNITGNIPAVQGDNYSVRIRGNTGRGSTYSNWRDITVENVSLEIVDVTGNPARDVDGNIYYFRGDELIVNYNLIGSAVNGVQLQIKDDDGNWINIGNDDPADETVNGTIPMDIDLPASPEIRVALSDSLYSNSWANLYTRYPDESDFPENSADSIYVEVEGNLDSDYYDMDSPTFAKEGNRTFETQGFDMSRGGYLNLEIYLLNRYWDYEHVVDKEAPIRVEYSIDNGSTWIKLNETNHLDYGLTGWQYKYVDIFDDYLPIEAQTPNTKFRVVQNDNGTLDFGENAWEFYLIEVYGYSRTGIVSNTKLLDLQQATITLGTLDKYTYGPGESITIPYNVVGNFGADIGFVTTITDDDNNTHVVESSDDAGQVALNTSLPVNLPETSVNMNEFDLKIFAYQKTADQQDPILGYMEDLLDEEEDLILVEGGEFDINNDVYLNEEGRRSILTKALPQLEGDSLTIEFDIDIYDNPFPSEGVVIELTTDGGTSFTVLDTVWESDYYTSKLATSDVNDQTHLRWVQYVNFGHDIKEWRINALTLKSANSNLISSGYLQLNQPAVIEIDYPNVPDQFTYNEQEEVLYSGETFTLELGVLDHVSKFSDQTEYLFYLGNGEGNVYVDYNGDSALLGTMTGLGTVDLVIPSTIYQDTYDVLITALVDDPDSDEPFVYFKEKVLLSLDIYNPLLKTLALQDEAYRGNDFTVNWELQTGNLNTSDYYFHLMLDDEVISITKGASANISSIVPTDINTGNKDVEVLVTFDSVYFEGESTLLDQFNDNEWKDAYNCYLHSISDYMRFDQVAGTNSAVTQDFIMSYGGWVGFNFQYNETGNEFTENSKVIFEYTSDGGATYNLLDTFPNETYKLDDGEEWQQYFFGRGNIGDTVKFRFRRLNGNYGQAFIHDLRIVELSNKIPVNTVADNLSVLEQEVFLGDIPEDICPGSSLEIDYEIKGKFGEDVIHTIEYWINGNGVYNFPDLEFLGIQSGTGTFTLPIPEGWSGGNYSFRVQSDDYTTDNDFTVYSERTPESVYLIPPINFTGTTLSGDENLCKAGVENYYIYSAQAGFQYQARDVNTGELYGDAVVSENGGTITMFTETIDTDLELEIVVKARNKQGTKTCATGVLQDRIKFNYIPARMLFAKDDLTSIFSPVDDSVFICEGNPDNLQLQAGYYDHNGSYTGGSLTAIGWYRDDMNTAVSSSTTLNSFNQSGAYFAQVVAEGCKYTTNSVKIQVLSVPDKPSVTVGKTTVCDGATVLLSVSNDYQYYKWYGGNSGTSVLSGSSPTLEATSTGAYRVTVSNHPLEFNCASPMSDPVAVTVLEKPETNISHHSGGTWVSEDNYVTCGNDVVLQADDLPSTYNWTLNGNVFASNHNSYMIKATKSGYYNVEMLVSDNGVTCKYKTEDSIYVTVSEELSRPSLTLTGDDKFCAGEGTAILTADEGYEYYLWYRNGSAHMEGNNEIEENTFSPDMSGEYSVRVKDSLGCISDHSKRVEINIVPEPSRYANLSTTYNNRLCGNTAADIQVYNIDGGRRLNYQLINMNTGQPSGQPSSMIDSDGGDYVLLTSDPISEDTEFGVLVSDQNASGCKVMLNQTIDILVQSAEIEVIGNTLYATTGGMKYQWYRNNKPILGSRGKQTYLEIFDDADYSVEIMFDYDCIVVTQAQKNATSISGNDLHKTIRCYPNPVKDELLIDINNAHSGKIKVEIADVTGKIVYNGFILKNYEKHTESVNVSSLNNGIYIVQFTSGDITETSRIVKE
ncbi:MAG: T9SS type A sorting domain-containing protein [Bacteroidales bacterium]